MILLLVDDDDDDYQMLCEALQEVHPAANCVQASHGAQALEILAATGELPDCIFLDIKMPHMDGREFLKQVKANPRTKNVLVIVYTASTRPVEYDSLIQLGAKVVIPKPSTFSTLVDTLKEALR